MTNFDPDGKKERNALKQRDHCAFTQLVKYYHDSMHALAASMIGDLADEVVQEAWVSIYRNLPNFREESSLKTWIFTIVSNEAKTRLRKEKRLIPLNNPDTNPEILLEPWLEQHFNSSGRWQHPPETWNLNSPEALLEENDLKVCIEHTLGLLPGSQKAVFILKDLQQLAIDEICNILEISYSNARVLLHRARLTLLNVIDNYQRTGEC